VCGLQYERRIKKRKDNIEMKVPMWHKRFMEAQNLMCRATSMMKQAHLEDKNNKKFLDLYSKMIFLSGYIVAQSSNNFERGHKEGWLR
jgi:hypothetical protein